MPVPPAVATACVPVPPAVAITVFPVTPAAASLVTALPPVDNKDDLVDMHRWNLFVEYIAASSLPVAC